MHISDEETCYLKPQEITATHVIVDIPHFSRVGLVWPFDIIWRLWNNRKVIKSQILLFLRPPNPKTQRQSLNVFLLPRNVPLEEVTLYDKFQLHCQCKLLTRQQKKRAMQPDNPARGSTEEPVIKMFSFLFRWAWNTEIQRISRHLPNANSSKISITQSTVHKLIKYNLTWVFQIIGFGYPTYFWYYRDPDTGAAGFQREEFDLDFGPNYHPTFEIRLPLNTEEAMITIRDQTPTVVWEREVDLTGKVSVHLQHRFTWIENRVTALSFSLLLFYSPLSNTFLSIFFLRPWSFRVSVFKMSELKKKVSVGKQGLE